MAPPPRRPLLSLLLLACTAAALGACQADRQVGSPPVFQIQAGTFLDRNQNARPVNATAHNGEPAAAPADRLARFADEITIERPRVTITITVNTNAEGQTQAPTQTTEAQASGLPVP